MTYRTVGRARAAHARRARTILYKLMKPHGYRCPTAIGYTILYSIDYRTIKEPIRTHIWNNTCKYPIYDINLVYTVQLSSKSRPPFPELTLSSPADLAQIIFFFFWFVDLFLVGNLWTQITTVLWSGEGIEVPISRHGQANRRIRRPLKCT
jgi:hypothetical protein